ncbi:DNA polymerase subunit Cdc27 [Rhypophila decipiens]|uniref:DNA polymerase delta subunit 3 n=1 Tax=Rhypophila decipiens TaxID=261697 RepID=A0AAN6Y1C6_9PEZI|nr:DNA polymerase subunit Cdc27 [Rhypophila decipiens]
MADYRKYLAENVLSESKVVTYRLLSRALRVHPNSAKQILYEFHKSENGKQPGKVHATYLVYGIKNAESSSQVQNGDGDIEMTSSMPEVESFDDAVPTFTLALIPEEQLKAALEQYDEVSSIHVYSLGPNPVKDLALLADAAQQALALNNNESQTLVITNSNMRRRERKGAVSQSVSSTIGAKAGKQEPKAVKSEPMAAKSDPKSALSKAFASAKPKTEPKNEVKEEPKSEKAEPSKSAPAALEKKTAPAPKRGGSNTSSIMQAFSKATTKKYKKAETSQPATPSGEDSSAQPMSDDGEDDSEVQPAPRGTGGRKTRKEREEELKRMMEEDDDEDEDDDESDKRADSPVEEPMDETVDEPAAPEPAAAEPAEAETTSANGRRRGKRKVMRKKQIMDDQGYLVTIQEAAWESFSEDEAPPATKPKISSAASSAPASQTSKAKKGAKGSQGTQGSIMSFFSKK